MHNVLDMQERFVKNVQDLEVFKLAYRVSLEIHKSSLGFPKIEQYALAGQIRRASKSICANLSEGFAKQPHSKAEFRRFISLALGSVEEVNLWLLYCRDLEYIDLKQYEAWSKAYLSIARMLQKLRANTKD